MFCLIYFTLEGAVRNSFFLQELLPSLPLLFPSIDSFSRMNMVVVDPPASDIVSLLRVKVLGHFKNSLEASSLSFLDDSGISPFTSKKLPRAHSSLCVTSSCVGQVLEEVWQ